MSSSSDPSRVATLICSPATACLTQEVVSQAAEAIGGGATYFLADGIAADIPVPADATDVVETLRKALGDAPVDVVVQEAENRRKRVLIADMDSTMIQQECIDELADEAGVGAEVSLITARAMRGEIEFEGALRERVDLLKGLPLSVIGSVLAKRITIMPGAAELVATMRANGAYTALVSGGFTHFTRSIADQVGFDENRANVFGVEAEQLDGTVVPPILGREAKVEALRDITARLGLAHDDVLAVGDGANDLGMLSIAGSGVALHAKPVVAAEARFRIDHGDLTALLYLQGYRKSDFVI